MATVAQEENFPQESALHRNFYLRCANNSYYATGNTRPIQSSICVKVLLLSHTCESLSSYLYCMYSHYYLVLLKLINNAHLSCPFTQQRVRQKIHSNWTVKLMTTHCQVELFIMEDNFVKYFHFKMKDEVKDVGWWIDQESSWNLSIFENYVSQQQNAF